MNTLNLSTTGHIILFIAIMLFVLPNIFDFGAYSTASKGLGVLWFFYALLVYFYSRYEGDVSVKNLHLLYEKGHGRLAKFPCLRHLWLYNHIIVAVLSGSLIAILESLI